MTTTEIFEPVQADLPKVDLAIRELDHVGVPDLGKMLDHVLGSPGKRIRPALTLLSGSFHDYKLDLLVPMAAAVEILHTATLIHDDTVDNALERRGLATLNSLWNSNLAVLAGDYLFANSADMVARTGNVRVMRLFAQTLMNIASGELSQVFSSYDASQSREEYFGRISRKTAALFSMATESGSLLSGAPEPTVQALRQYGSELGIAFQIVDDIFDFVAESADIGKPVGNDLRSGTLTLPALLVSETYPDRNLVSQYFEHRDEEVLKTIVELSRGPEIIETAYNVASEFASKAAKCLVPLPECDAKRSLIELTDYVVSRRN